MLFSSVQERLKNSKRIHDTGCGHFFSPGLGRQAGTRFHLTMQTFYHSLVFLYVVSFITGFPLCKKNEELPLRAPTWHRQQELSY